MLTLAAVIAVVVFSRHQPSMTPADGVKRFEVLGEVRSVDAADKSIRIKHEKIPDYMPAMTMSLPVKDTALLKGLSVGDSVRFQLAVTDDDAWIARIEKIAAEGSAGAAKTGHSEPTLQDRENERVKAGEAVPDFNLIDQDGRKFRLSDLRGKAVVLTFIYTRCPLPTFCPLMMKNFSQLQERLNSEFANRYQLLSVTMDPDFDTPEVLKAYASRYQANPKDWTFVTGDAEQIKFVAGLMGLYYARENGQISHDLRTALIGPDGKLVHLWKSNVWTPYEVQRMVGETLAGEKGVAVR